MRLHRFCCQPSLIDFAGQVGLVASINADCVFTNLTILLKS